MAAKLKSSGTATCMPPEGRSGHSRLENKPFGWQPCHSEVGRRNAERMKTDQVGSRARRGTIIGSQILHQLGKSLSSGKSHLMVASAQRRRQIISAQMSYFLA